MEAVTAIGLATNIIQLIEVVSSITSTARDIARSASGFSKEAELFRKHAASVCRDMDLVIQSNDNEKYDAEFRDYAASLRKHVKDYIGELDALKMAKTGGWIQPLKAAVKVRWRRARMEESMRLIQTMGDQITTHIIAVYLPTLNSKLGDLQMQNQESGSRIFNEMTHLQDAIQQLHSTHSNGNELMRITKAWFKDQEAIKIQRRCLGALFFQDIYKREDGVASAHQRTFEWLLNDTSGKAMDPSLSPETDDDPLHCRQTSKVKFCDWLQSSDTKKNVFWISGKPGAGKSTLMKFIAQHHSLPGYLKSWAGPHKVVITQFFFWHYGDDLQKSIMGLLRSVLFQILKKHRQLIPVAFPDQEWSTVGGDHQFSKATLQRALHNLLNSVATSEYRFFFLIDGLDEFDDREEHDDDLPQETDLLEFLRDIRQAPKLKVCLSSRPWLSFQKEFGTNDSLCLRIHDLTEQDIRLYIHETLQQNEAFMELSASDSDYLILVSEMLEAAQGVFLWVHLACQSLLAGITNEDQLYDLHARLKQLPRKLEQLYKHILTTIPLRYLRQAARCLLIASACNQAPHLEYEPRDYKRRLDTLLAVYHFADDIEYSKALMLDSMHPDDFAGAMDSASKRIVVYTRGLLEFSRRRHENRGKTRLPSSYNSTSVELTHRSLGDFLHTEEIHDQLVKSAQLPSTLDHLFLRSHVATLNCLCSITKFLQKPSPEVLLTQESLSDLWHEAASEMRNYLSQCRKYALKELQDGHEPPYTEELAKALIRPLGGYVTTGVDACRIARLKNKHPKLLFAVMFGASQRCQMALNEIPDPAADDACAEMLILAIWDRNYLVARVMLENQVNHSISIFMPEGEVKITAWELFLQQLFSEFYFVIERKKSNLELALQFLRHGVKLDAPCTLELRHGGGDNLVLQRASLIDILSEGKLLRTLVFSAADTLRCLFNGTEYDVASLIPADYPTESNPDEVLSELIKTYSITPGYADMLYDPDADQVYFESNVPEQPEAFC
jgi:hypothetical protein